MVFVARAEEEITRRNRSTLPIVIRETDVKASGGALITALM